MKLFSISIILGLILLFGCLGIGETPKNTTAIQPPTGQNQSGTGTTTTTTIIVNPQQNQTIIQQNQTSTQPQLNQSQNTEPDFANETNALIGVYFIDVAGPETHGNSVLIRKGNFDMLIDAGPAENAGKVVDLLRSKGVDDIDVLVSSNADPRNYGGINRVADAFSVEAFWWGASTNDPAYLAMIDRMSTNTKSVKRVDLGFTADYNGIHFEVLNPSKTPFNDVNNDAIVLKISDRNFSVLLTSGIQFGAREKLVGEMPDKLNATIVQAPYFGTGTGTSGIERFLTKTKPKMIIMTGSADDSATNGGSRQPFKNLLKLSQYNVSYKETYVSGTIKITSDGKAYSVE